MAEAAASAQKSTGFIRGLGLLDSTMIVAGSMIGSGIFIVSADIAREVGAPGWLLVVWLVTGLLTLMAALSYGELAAMMPKAGGQYVYLREAFSPLWGFLYGWTLFLVIQTGTIAAVSVGFAKFLGVLWPKISVDNYVIAPVRIGSGYALSLSTAQLVGVVMIVLLTFMNTRGLKLGKLVQNVFTITKTGSLIALILLGVFLGWNADAVHLNFGNFWHVGGKLQEVGRGLTAAVPFGLFVGICVAQTNSLFSADAWNNITFTAGEVKNPKRNIPLSLAFGTILVITLYLLANVAYLVTLPFDAIKTVPADRVASATANVIFPGTRRHHHGGRDHDLDLRLQQRTDSGGRARLLRDGARRSVLQIVRPVERQARSRLGTGRAGNLGCGAGSAAHHQPGRNLRIALQRFAYLRDLGGADLLHSYHSRNHRAQTKAA